MDLGSGVSRGAVFVPAIRELGAAVLVVTGIDDVDVIAEALESGAVGFVRKHQPFDDLLGAIRRATDGEDVNHPDVRAAVLGDARRVRSAQAAVLADLRRLTAHEQAVLAALMGDHGPQPGPDDS
ncbi:hypothetical protein [Euzebya sp.]|uniref:hypothetical protein n=1 Tax=Euzebya sp. TaxID=1971409 RepID=UPI003517AFA4